MKSVEATASGKVILFGEHAVVYGRPAIAVPVTDVRAQARLQTAEPGSGFRIIAPDLNRDFLLASAELNNPLATIVQITLKHLDRINPPDVVLNVSSTIPLGRGLGSGAAISTAIVRALGQFFGHSLPPADISTLVYEVEKLYHGTPSGIDNTVVAFEQPVYFIRGRPIQRMKMGQPLTIVIGDTGVVASTREVVADVRQRWQNEPEQYEGYFDEIGTIARQAQAIIEHGTPGLPALGKLMDENQELLETLGVSSPELERLIRAARQAGAIGAKLSGSGWGGNMLALVPPQPEVITAVTESLTKAGAARVIITVVN